MVDANTQVPQGLDPKAFVLTKAIALQENGGKTPSYTVKGGSGEFGAYQFTPDTWASTSSKYLGKSAPDLFSATPDQQNQVAYSQVKEWLDAGHTPAEVAAMWNAGRGRPDAWKGNAGTNSSGVAYDTQAYAKGVQKHAERLYASMGTSGAQNATQAPASDPNDPLGGKTFSELYGGSQASQQDQSQGGAGVPFPAAEGDNPIISGLKTLGNTPASAFSFGKGVLESMNPVEIAKKIGAIPGAFKEALDANGGDVQKTVTEFLKNVPGEAYKQLVPAFGQKLVQGDVEGARQEVTNNPVGSIAPFVFAAEGLAKGVDAATGASASDAAAAKAAAEAGKPVPARTGATGAFGRAVETVASPVTTAASKIASGVSNTAASMGRYAFGQATGLEPSTIETRIANPKVDMSTLSRGSLGETVGSALQQRIESLSDTGQGYAEIRSSEAPVKVAPDFLRGAIEDAAGVKFTEKPVSTPKTAPLAPGELPTIQLGEEAPTGSSGRYKIEATGDSAVRASGDVAKLQRTYDFWQPYFESGQMTPAQFLNFRADLAKMADYEGGIGKSTPLESAGATVREHLNSEYRSQIDGLEARDADYSSQATELKNLRKGILDKNGNLTDGAINKVANAIGKGKDILLSRLEEISPGITKQIQLVKMAEDFERAAGNKVGTYTRATLGAGGLAGGIATANIPLIAASIGEMLIQNPSVSDAIIRTYGSSKPIMTGVAAYLRKGAQAVNNAPTTLSNTSVFGRSQTGLPAGR